MMAKQERIMLAKQGNGIAGERHDATMADDHGGWSISVSMRSMDAIIMAKISDACGDGGRLATGSGFARQDLTATAQDDGKGTWTAKSTGAAKAQVQGESTAWERA
ncbi:MAG: hypothetical protein ACLFU7_12195 [Armatimonadota bacterium]